MKKPSSKDVLHASLRLLFVLAGISSIYLILMVIFPKCVEKMFFIYLALAVAISVLINLIFGNNNEHKKEK